VRRKRWYLIGAALLVVSVVGLGLRQAPRAEHARQLSLLEQQRSVQGAPPLLALLHRQAGQLLPGGETAFRRQIRSLRGFPVVVNIWASWCPPCRQEGPLFQQVSSEFGRRVAFIGVDSNDAAQDARSLLERIPVTYPSFSDPSEREARRLGLAGLPATVFYDRRGNQLVIHQGQYRTAADLRAAVAGLL
jgi:cytochrome c biogenesis protein CcmG/thiol:disulfide interchange protein DsbE